MKKKLSIIIPTCDRYQFLKRLINFLNKENLFEIFVLDSSKKKIRDNKILKQKNVHYKYFSNSKTIHYKISKICKYIKTKYVVICADDDFLIPEGLLSSLKFLEKNSDYASAHGLYFAHPNFDEIRNGLNFNLFKLYRGGSAEENSPQDRVYNYLSGKNEYYPYYAVHRTSQFKSIWGNVYKYVFTNMGFGEILPCCLSLIQGKMKVIPVFYMSKESNNSWNFFSISKNKKIYSPRNFKFFFKSLRKNLKIYSKNQNKKFEKIFSIYKKEIIQRANKKYKRKNKVKSLLTKLKLKIGSTVRFRTRISNLFLDGCHIQLYPKHLYDYKKLKDSVLKEKLGYSSLNQNR